ncbi:MAG: oligosaccharide flippase family protein [Chloroflexi bacterium]|nr:oligosaccharide flippase family protein [Chloroflexota bacterium]
MENNQTGKNRLTTLRLKLGITNLKLNIIANLIGRIWIALMSLAFVPIYIKLLGVESYGLIGFYASLQTIFALLDLGLGATMYKEVSSLLVQEGKAQQLRNLVKTVELIYWGLAAFIALLIAVGSPLIAHYWITGKSLEEATVQQALILMGLVIASQFVFNFYSGGILGLQRQVLFNAISIVMATLRGVGVIGVLWLISPTIQLFFAWQLLISVVQTVLCGWILWQSLPHTSERTRFQMKLLAGIKGFALSMAGNAFLSLLLTQADKILLSKMLTLENFGYYSLATVVSSGLYIIVSPINVAVFPQFVQLVSKGEDAAFKYLYHRSCQLLSVTVLPVATILALFAPEILGIWLGNPVTVKNTSLLVSLLVTGTAIYCLMSVPYYAMLAHNWTSLALYQSLVAVIVIIPALFWATSQYGALGAASIWIMLNLFFLVSVNHLMYKRILQTEKLKWYYQDVGLPWFGALAVALPARLLLPSQLSFLLTIGAVSSISLLTLSGACLTTPLTRNLIKNRIFPQVFSKM